MPKIKTLIVDDEQLARRSIRLLLDGDSEIKIIGECDNGLSALKLIRAEKPELVFLDIQMPGMNGFEVLEAIGTENIMPTIVFVTAFDEHAIRAFEFNALDYLLKPFSDERFHKALARAKSQIAQDEISDLSKRLLALAETYNGGSTATAKPETAYLSRFMIKGGGRITFVKVEEIDWIEAADYYVKLHVGRKAHLIRETMSQLEKKLNPNIFARIHRSTIINIDRIKELHPYFNGDYVVLLNDGVELKLSRARRETLHNLLLCR